MKFTAHSMRFHYRVMGSGTEIGPIDLGAITSTDIPFNSETRGDDGGGIYDLVRYLVSQMTQATFTTTNIQEIIKLTGLNGVCFEEDSGIPGIELYGQVVDDCDGQVNTTNIKIVFTRGLLRTTQLQCDRTNDVNATFMIDALTDDNDSTPVVVVDSGVTLPLLSTLIINKYAMGIATVSTWDTDPGPGTTIGPMPIREPNSYTLDFGHVLLDKMPAVGSIYAKTAGVRKTQPVMTVEALDSSMWDNVLNEGLRNLGNVCTHDDTRFSFKKRAAVDAFELTGNAEHFNLTMSGMAFINNPFATQGDSASTLNLRVEGTQQDDQAGSNVPVFFNFDEQYPFTP